MIKATSYAPTAKQSLSACCSMREHTPRHCEVSQGEEGRDQGLHRVWSRLQGSKERPGQQSGLETAFCLRAEGVKQSWGLECSHHLKRAI